MKKKIYIKDWLELKPYESHKPTDTYYLKMANEIKSVFKNMDFLAFRLYLDETEINTLCCFLVSYFEDVVSATNIFNTFRKEHKALYERPLPFYNIRRYYEDEINKADVTFLSWYFLNTVQQRDFALPHHKVFPAFADRVMDIFDREYEYAPENEALKPYYKIDENETDYYKIRGMVETILLGTYLFHPDTALDMISEEEEIFENKKNDKNLVPFLQENRDSFYFKIRTRLLALSGTEWAAGLAGKEHPLYSDIRSITQRISGFFLYKGQSEKTIQLEHIASGKKFVLNKASFDHYAALTEIDTILFMGIVRWQNEWWFSGIFYLQDFNADLILDEKNSVPSRRQVAFLDFERKETAEILKKQERAFLGFNNASHIAFMKTDQIENFITGYNNFYNESLDLTDQEIQDAHDRSKKEGFLKDQTKLDFDFPEDFEVAIVFFNPKSGIEMAFNCNSAFPASNNPYFNPEESDEDVHYILTSEEISKELADYCLVNFKDKLTFFENTMNQKLVKDIDFLLRFWKRHNYQTEPQITLTGLEEQE